MTLYPAFRCTLTVRIFLAMYWLVPCISPLPKSEASCAPALVEMLMLLPQRAAHVGGDLPDGVHLHRVRDEDAGLSVRVIDRKLHGDNRAVVFQRGNLDVEPLTLYLARADHHRTPGYCPACHRHRLQQAQPYRLPVRHALRPMHTRRYGVPVRYLRRADSRVETPGCVPARKVATNSALLMGCAE